MRGPPLRPGNRKSDDALAREIVEVAAGGAAILPPSPRMHISLAILRRKQIVGVEFTLRRAAKAARPREPSIDGGFSLDGGDSPCLDGSRDAGPDRYVTEIVRRDIHTSSNPSCFAASLSCGRRRGIHTYASFDMPLLTWVLLGSPELSAYGTMSPALTAHGAMSPETPFATTSLKDLEVGLGRIVALYHIYL